MRRSRISVLSTAAASVFVFGALAACSRENPAPGPEQNTVTKQLLWDTSSQDLAAVLVPFLAHPTLDPSGVAHEFTWSEEGIPILGTGDLSQGNELWIDESGFRTILGAYVVEKEDLAPLEMGSGGFALRMEGFSERGNSPSATIEVYKLKGDTDFKETRVFTRWVDGTPSQRFSIELRVFDSSSEQRTVGELLAHLRKHYAKYIRLCDAVAMKLRAK